MDEAEPFDWTPEINLVKGLLLPERVQVLLDYLDAARKRASARSQVFVRTVIEDSGLDGEGLAARLRDDAEFAALFEAALEVGMRSAHDRKVQLLARVVAQAANDTATVDDAELVASTIRELEPPHVRALAILGDYKPQNPDASGVAAVLEGMAGLRTRRPGKVSGSSQVLQALMGVSADVADSVSATLEREGLERSARLRRMGDQRLWSTDPGLAEGYQGRCLLTASIPSWRRSFPPARWEEITRPAADEDVRD
jgi:hypothetical protein